MSRTRFDAPRPAVTNRLGKKQTDRLIRADGDTWHEFFAVSEKPNHANTSNASSRSSRFLLFGKNDKKKENSKKKSTRSKSNLNDNGDGNNLIIRSYYQNNRTGKKVWDEPPSGASKIVPASQEMRRMAELQLDELYVVTDSTDFQDFSESTSSSGRSKSRTSLFRRANSNASNSVSSGSSKSASRRIRYKPNSHLYPLTASVKSHKSGERDTINDQQLQEAIDRSIAETTGPAAKHDDLSEDDILRRVLEESRLEALASSRSQNSDRRYYDDRKPSPRKHSPMRRCPIDGESSYSTRQTKGNRW